MKKCPKCGAPPLNPRLPGIAYRSFECGYVGALTGKVRGNRKYIQQRPCTAHLAPLHKYEIEVSWSITDTIKIRAMDEDHAVEIVNDAPLTRGEFLADSFSINHIKQK